MRTKIYHKIDLYLFLEDFRCGLRDYLATVLGYRLTSIDFFTKKKPITCVWKTWFLDRKFWQSARNRVFSRLAHKWTKNNVSSRQNKVHRISKTDRRTSWTHFNQHWATCQCEESQLYNLNQGIKSSENRIGQDVLQKYSEFSKNRIRQDILQKYSEFSEWILFSNDLKE